MPPQRQFIVPIVFVCHLVAVGVLGAGSAARAGECLDAPNGPSATGHHWFYRIDRASHRKCWYQRAHDAPRAARPRSQRKEVAEALPPAEPEASPTAFSQAPIRPEIVAKRDAISDFSWPKPADQTDAAARDDVGVSRAIKQAGPTPRIVPVHKAPDARLANATDGMGQNPTRAAPVTSATPAASSVPPASASDSFTPFRLLLLFIGIVVVPGVALLLIFKFGASTWKKMSSTEQDSKIWRDSVTHDWAPSKLDGDEAPSVRPKRLASQPVDPAMDPEQLLRKILQDLEHNQAGVKTKPVTFA
jgi:hypothetical protein